MEVITKLLFKLGLNVFVCFFQNLFSQLKSAPRDSLTSRLALCLCLVNYNYGGLRAVAQVWQEFVLELRYRWENNYLIFG